MDTVFEFYDNKNQQMTCLEKLVQRISNWISNPRFLILLLWFVCVWILINYLVNKPFDLPPFHYLQGFIGLLALLAAIIVLANQSRLAKFEEQRAHLDLKVNLLTEQRTAKLIELIEELRNDLPNVLNRLDADANKLKNPMNPEDVIATLKK